ncbi:Hsp20/alpha crystallin family protein [Pyrobaculum calidifontis]|uniref:Heat shock protein Hsp20 n=1 Tax=Pyrobaculum calidifontis (strain DSM 21063 / JCM 11548 / VA1) TaxID=410359 RepID=A3MX90_PYRCJ|nr:Hsp20/alpha crystallin family protein [Pyrobaculum calidifontis]ABO09257.1 heat shock protein Hsp20 [Pyrobaculum calidifontis JCM 11548]
MDEFRKAMEELAKSIQKIVESATKEATKAVQSVAGEGREYRIREEGEELIVEIDMPGLEAQDISLTISKDGAYIRAEGARGDRKYAKYIRLPVRIDPSSASAVYRNGVLYITAKKVKEEEIRVPVRG